MGCLPEGLIDWDAVYSAVQPYATFSAGIIFGLAWWVWADALVHSIAVGRSSFSPLTLLPGLAATLAVLIMNCVGREEVQPDYWDDAAAVRGKVLLVLSYVFSVAAICGAVALLVVAQRGGKDMWVGASGVLQCCLVLVSGLLCWFFHTSEDAAGVGYGYL